MENVPLEQDNVGAFVDFLYEGLEGYVYLAASDRKIENDWKQEFFKFPEQRNDLINVIRHVSKNLEVYLAPAIYKSPLCNKDSFKASNVVWTEFDGNAPNWSTEDANPSLIIQTSDAKNQHVYWRLNEPITNVNELEDVNRRITYNMGADSSAWDATQVLRPPDTLNHKNDPLPVFIIESNGNIFDTSIFNALEAPPLTDTTEWSLSVVPEADEVLLRYAFGPDLVRLLAATKEEIKDRSVSLMNLAYGCAELGMSNNEIMAVLVRADDRWEKFKNRKDRFKRLSHIIVVARNKHPETDTLEDYAPIVFGFQSLLDTEINIDWLIEPMLLQQGNMLLVGPSGIGKTQWTIQVMIHLALGKDFLHYKVSEPQKMLFLSLEMGHGELKKIMEDMRKSLTDKEAEILDQNFLIVPHGEPWALNTPVGQQQAIELIESHQPDGFVVDSIGSAVLGNISSTEVNQPLTAFNDKIRKKYGLFTWYIHHLRKGGKDSKPTQDDVYGDQYLFNRATSSYSLTSGKNETIRVENFKQRLAMKEKTFYVSRDDNINFHLENESIDEGLEIISNTTIDKGKNGIIL